MILRGLKKVFFYHYNIFFIKSQFSGFFWAIWRGARSIKNFAYGCTDREIGPGRPTPARPTPPLLYHKPQALSIGNLHKKNSGRFFCPKILIIICVIIIFIPHRCEIIAIVEWVFQRTHTRLRIVCVVRTIPTIYRAMIMFHFSSSSGSSSYSQGAGQLGSAWQISIST